MFLAINHISASNAENSKILKILLFNDWIIIGSGNIVISMSAKNAKKIGFTKKGIKTGKQYSEP